MTRFVATLEYDGGPFVGWQRQDNGLSVQQCVEDAVFKFCGEAVLVQGAGRTDAGVHAWGQVAHFDLVKPVDAFRVQEALNFHLKPQPIAVVACVEAPPAAAGAEFHARFSATKRVYRYRIVNRRAPLAIERGRAWQVAAPLDADAMYAAAKYLLGQHDFSSFRAAECRATSPVKTLDVLSVSRYGDELVVAAEARSFLHHQVRNMVGTLKAVGEGKLAPQALEKILKAKDRSAAGITAPAEGLYLVRVEY